MKVVILAGGRGTRLGEESDAIPKPMVKIGEHPILWHIMKIFSAQGFHEFVILLGYQGFLIKDYFANYLLHHSSVTISLSHPGFSLVESHVDPWSVTLVDTGLDSMTGSRIKQAQKFIGQETFMLTYGDGLANIDLSRLLEYHRAQQPTVTMTVVEPESQYGQVTLSTEQRVINFSEKPKKEATWVNAGFFVCEPTIFNYLSSEPPCIFERAPLENLAHSGELGAFQHRDFWKSLDTARDKVYLQGLWESDSAPWKLWS